MLPGPRPGNTLGVNNNLDLILLTPIKAPLIDNVFQVSVIQKIVI